MHATASTCSLNCLTNRQPFVSVQSSLQSGFGKTLPYIFWVRKSGLFCSPLYHISVRGHADWYYWEIISQKYSQIEPFHWTSDICLIIYLDFKLIRSLNFNRITDSFICNSIPIILIWLDLDLPKHMSKQSRKYFDWSWIKYLFWFVNLI